MKKKGRLIALGVGGLLAVLFPACEEEQTPTEPQPTPDRESTVVQLVANAWDPYYSPDSRRVVFVEAYHLAVYDTVNRESTTITPDYGSLEFTPRAPVWLAGDTIAFIRKEDSANAKYKIWTVPAVGGQVTAYDVSADAESSLEGSADGRYVYYTAETELLLYRLDLTNGGTVKLTTQHIVGYGHFDATQKPGANTIYFVERKVPFTTQPHSEYINEVKASGGGIPRAILNTDKPFLDGLTVSPDDKYLVYGHRDGLFAYEHRSGNETWLTRAPDKWTDKDHDAVYAPDGFHIAFTRNNNIYVCDAL